MISVFQESLGEMFLYIIMFVEEDPDLKLHYIMLTLAEGLKHQSNCM